MRMLVTAGPTREYFDSVRYISNASSGRMGFAIAAEAHRRGHNVVLVAGPVDHPDPPGIKTVRVVSAKDMLDAVVARFSKCHACVMTAAVCDYRPAKRFPHKLKKQARSRTLPLVPTEDILTRLGTKKDRRVLVGFAMEDRNARKNAEAKLRRKQCDAIVLNGPANVGGTTARVQILRKGGRWEKPIAGTKFRIAEAVVDLVESMYDAA